MFERRRRLFVEHTDIMACRLKLPSAVVEIAEFGDEVVADRLGSRAARIVGEPSAVEGPHEVMGDDHRLLGNGHNWEGNLGDAKPQAARGSVFGQFGSQRIIAGAGEGG